MRQVIILSIIGLFYFSGQSQERFGNNGNGREELPEEGRTEDDRAEVPMAPISEYKKISVSGDTTHVDTSLTIYDDYRFNYLRKDNFELLPFSNVGQTYSHLTYKLPENQVVPLFGARARHYNFMEADDIHYYHVPTPFTELYFKTVFEQGQTLDSFFTINTSENLNFSIAYKGLRSLGKYQHMLVSTGNFRTTVSYHTPDRRYDVRMHFVSQDLMNEENGGLTENALENFLDKNPEFDDRSRLDVRFQDAQSTLYGKRFFLDHSFRLSGDAEQNNGLKIGHTLNYTYKKYVFQQETASDFFGPSFEEVNVKDETRLESFYNEGFLEYESMSLGRLRLKGGWTHFNYGYNSVLDLDSGFIENRLVGDVFASGGEYQKELGNLKIKADGLINIAGDLDGHNLEGELSYKLGNESEVAVLAEINERAPNWNFLLYQSDYINYNWQNDDFSNIATQSLRVKLTAPEWVNLEASYSRVENHTYFMKEDEGVKPFQYGGRVNFARLKAERDFDFGKFGLANTLLFQKVMEGEEVVNVPSFVTRNSFFYQDHWFRRALFLQTGFTVRYFPAYQMDGYDPVLAEFYVQDQQELQGMRSLDFFFNGKIRTARIFFTLERLDAVLLGNDNLVAPSYPSRDFAVRFGLVWNFFM